MHVRTTLLAVPFLCFLSAAAQQTAPPDATTALTIYNQDFAVARTLIPLKLQAGINDVTTTEVTTQLEPDSVVLRDPARSDNPFRILEQNYDSGVVTQAWLLQKFEGKTIDFLTIPAQTGISPSGAIVSIPQQTVKGTILRAGNQPLIQVDGQMRFQLPGTPLFPANTDGLLLKPTLHWQIRSEKAQSLQAELAYVTGGFTWQATYNVVAPESSDVTSAQQADFVGWVTITNNSGTDFPAARIKLMAGDVAKIRPGVAGMERAKALRSEMAAVYAAPEVTQKSFDDFHLYDLNRTVHLHEGEIKQVQFLSASGVTITRKYVYDGASINYAWQGGGVNQDRSYGLDDSNHNVAIQQEIKNSAANHLGVPLPAGRLRVYRRDTGGQMEFVGESTIPHTPTEDTVKLITGNAFDVKGTRKQTDFHVNAAGHVVEESFEVKLTNQKDQPITVQVVEHLYRAVNWQMTDKSSDYTKLDSHTVSFPMQVAAKGEAKLTYAVRYTW